MDAFAAADPEDTLPSPPQPGRRQVAPGELVRWMSERLQLVEGCGNVTVVDVARLHGCERDGCNWSRAVVLEPHGTPAQIYALACAEIVEHARLLFNLKSGSGTDF